MSAAGRRPRPPGLAPWAQPGFVSWPEIPCNLRTASLQLPLTQATFQRVPWKLKSPSNGTEFAYADSWEGDLAPEAPQESLAGSRHLWPDCVWPPGAVLRQDGLTGTRAAVTAAATAGLPRTPCSFLAHEVEVTSLSLQRGTRTQRDGARSPGGPQVRPRAGRACAAPTGSGPSTVPGQAGAQAACCPHMAP